MKKILLILLALIFILGSCGEVSNTVDTQGGSTAAVTADTSVGETASETEDVTSPPESVTAEVTEAETETETEQVTTKPEPIEIVTPTEMFVTINEVCASNKGCFTDGSGETPDWIELYNSSDRAVNLAGYGISDDETNPMRYTFSNYLIEAGSYVILLASGNVGYNKSVISLPFKLSSAGETLTLTAPDGITDTLVIPELGEDETYGRITDGGDMVCHLTPTPLSTNNTAVSIIKVPAPELSHVSGFYGSPFELEITVPENCVVHYTTDGSTPTAESALYAFPIGLDDATYNPNVFSAIGGNTVSNFITKNNQDKANVIRAVAIDSEGHMSPVTSGTFFITRAMNEDNYKDMPILSVYTDAHNLFDYETGIYVLGKTYDDYINGPDYDPSKPTWARPANYFLDGEESERPAAIEYFDSEHNFCFGQEVGIRIGGNTSQSSQQKSFKFYARSEYGKSSFDYPLFEGVEFYDTFLMRTGANDFAKTKIRDVLTQTLVSHRDISTAKWQPCVMFLNGEYWGFYMMMERYDSDYFEQHYGVDKDEIVAIKTGDVDIGTEEDKELYRELRSFCRDNDLTVAENYEKLCSMIDMQSYIDYVCMNIIISNGDWPGNNTELWRTRNVDPTNPYADGRWRWVVYDTERAMLIYGKDSDEDFDVNSYEKLIKKGLIFGHVYKNESFKDQFLTTLMDMLTKDFARDRIDEYLEYFVENYNTQMVRNRLRYNTTSNYPKEFDAIRTFWDNRTEYLMKYTCELFEIGNEITEAVIKTENGEGCGILLYDYELPLEDGRYSCEYLVGGKLTLTAKAGEGYGFSCWRYQDGTVAGTENTLTLDLSQQGTVTAVFERSN